MQDVERRINRARSALSGNEALLEGLDTEAASTLLCWGHDLARNILSETFDLDDASAEEATAPRMRALRTMLKRLNLAAAARFSADPTPAAAFLQQAAAQAALIYSPRFAPPSEEACRDFLQQTFPNPQAFLAAVRPWLESMIS